MKWEPPPSKKRMYRKQKGCCFYCGRAMPPLGEPCDDPGRKPTTDHIIPLARGGKNRLGNTVLACHRCNNFKGSKPWKHLIDHLRKQHGHTTEFPALWGTVATSNMFQEWLRA